jgi:hypothetical protein
LRRRAVRGRYAELVKVEEAFELPADRDAERLADGLVEPPARREVLHHELDMIDQTSAMQLHDALLAVAPVGR